MSRQDPEWVAMIGHFCEIHGPVTVLATYKRGTFSPPSIRTGGCASCRLDRSPVLGEKYITSVPPRELIPQLQRLCLRSFVSSDSSDDAPLMIADPEMGAAIIQRVRLGPRLYVLGLLSPAEGIVMRRWSKAIGIFSYLSCVLNDMATVSAFRVPPREQRSLADITSANVWEIIHKELGKLVV